MLRRLLSFLQRKFNYITNSPNRFCNTIPDKVDIRDKTFLSSQDDLPKYHLMPNKPPIRNQGVIGSCASHAVIGAYEMQMSENQFLEGSELFHYYYARHLNNTFPNDKGMCIRDACKTLHKFGMAPEMLWKYHSYRYNEKPSHLANVFAKLYKVKRYERIYSLVDINKSINVNIPVICGIHVQKSFYNLNHDGIYKPTVKTGGGHAVLIVGYDEREQRFIIRNSWGEDWGRDGYFFMPYDNFKKTSFDWWRIIK